MTSVGSTDKGAATPPPTGTNKGTTTPSSPSPSKTHTSNVSSKSDIDWDALIEAAVLQKRLPADRISNKISKNETKIESYTKMQELLGDLLDSVETITGTSKSISDKDDVLSKREAYLTGLGGVDAANSLVVTATAGAPIQTYDVKIHQVATSQKVASASQSSAYEPLGYKGTISLSMEGADIPVNKDGDEDPTLLQVKFDDTMTLYDIATEINTKTEYTGVTATVVAVGENDYRLVMTGKTGADIVMDTVEGDDLAQSLGITDGSGAYVNQLQSSQVAKLSVDGVEVTRESNTVDDVIEGVTFSLYQETKPGESISVEIGQSLSSIKDAIVSLADSYNAYREWAITQQAIDASGSVSSDATLFGDNMLRSVNSEVARGLAQVVDSEGLSLLGLSYDENNYLVLEEDDLNDALLNNIDQIADVLIFQYKSTDSNLAVLRRNADMPSDLVLDVSVDESGELTGVLANGDAGQFEVDGRRIVGAEGTDYEGIVFVYSGDKDSTITFSSSAGLAEKLFQSLNKYTDEDNGLLTEKIASLQKQNEDYQADYDDSMSKIKAYEARLTNLYSSYQAAIEAAQSSLDYLKAILGTGDK